MRGPIRVLQVATIGASTSASRRFAQDRMQLELLPVRGRGDGGRQGGPEETSGRDKGGGGYGALVGCFAAPSLYPNAADGPPLSSELGTYCGAGTGFTGWGAALVCSLSPSQSQRRSKTPPVLPEAATEATPLPEPDTSKTTDREGETQGDGPRDSLLMY